ncbi:MAG: class B sortase [Eubacteriales bacterium]|nr:class B sortase [Eubacteriales bacterium]
MGEKTIRHRILKAANSVITFLVVAALCVCGAYAAYALWDNNRIYAAAENVQADMLKLKPNADAPDGPSFAELLAVNPDVCAWITVDNTKIDYPVLQGETNLSYINTDVYGNFALAGSIYLDSRNASDFSEPCSLLYGHHMENGGMFGDLDLFKNKAFFDENRTGTLLVPGKGYDLEIFACLLVSASEDNIFEPDQWRTDIDGLLDYAEQHALYVRQETIETLRASKAPQVLALSTCSSEFSDARTIVLAAMQPRMAAK